VIQKGDDLLKLKPENGDMMWCVYINLKRVWRMKREVMLGVKVLSLCILILGVRIFALGSLIVHVINVGQGDSILIEFPSGKKMLIDAGDTFAKEDVISFLRHQDATKLDWVVVTHPHIDHFGTLVYNWKYLKVGTFIEYKEPRVNIAYKELIKQVKASKTPIVKWKWPDKFEIDGVKIWVLNPYDGCDAEYQDNYNNYSIVLLLEYAGRRILLTGDAETPAEQRVVEHLKEIGEYDTGEFTILKAGHHGSSTSSSYEFLNAIKPSYIAISVGKYNDYGHPNPDTVRRLKKYGRVWMTKDVGTITFVMREDTVEVFTGFKDGVIYGPVVEEYKGGNFLVWQTRLASSFKVLWNGKVLYEDDELKPVHRLPLLYLAEAGVKNGDKIQIINYNERFKKIKIEWVAQDLPPAQGIGVARTKVYVEWKNELLFTSGEKVTVKPKKEGWQKIKVGSAYWWVKAKKARLAIDVGHKNIYVKKLDMFKKKFSKIFNYVELESLSDLRGVDVLLISNPKKRYSKWEVNAITKYYKGALVMWGASDWKWLNGNKVLNGLLEKLGESVRINSDTVKSGSYAVIIANEFSPALDMTGEIVVMGAATLLNTADYFVPYVLPGAAEHFDEDGAGDAQEVSKPYVVEVWSKRRPLIVASWVVGRDMNSYKKINGRWNEKEVEWIMDQLAGVGKRFSSVQKNKITEDRMINGRVTSQRTSQNKELFMRRLMLEE